MGWRQSRKVTFNGRVPLGRVLSLDISPCDNGALNHCFPYRTQAERFPVSSFAKDGKDLTSLQVATGHQPGGSREVPPSKDAL